LVAVFVASGLRDVRNRARRRRSELERVVNDFVQLIAVALTTNRSVEEAIGFAADAGDGFAFDLLRRTIATADPMGVPVWAALATMADTYQLPDLRGLCGSLEHQAAAGVAVASTLRAEAKALRAKQLAGLIEQADASTANVQLPTIGMVVGVIVFLAYPVLHNIGTAFRR
jgi:Flp pilus assembly protein TadB